MGDKGDPGDRGVRGFTGEMGPQGSQGDVGFYGTQGYVGNQGHKGAQGEIGANFTVLKYTGSQDPMPVSAAITSPTSFTILYADVITPIQITSTQSWTYSPPEGVVFRINLPDTTDSEVVINLGNIGWTIQDNEITTDQAITTTSTYIPGNMLTVYFENGMVNSYINSTQWFTQSISSMTVSFSVSSLTVNSQLAFTGFTLQPLITGSQGIQGVQGPQGDKGPKGNVGTRILSGYGSPVTWFGSQGEMGSQGDFYIDLTNGVFYGPMA